MPGVVMNGKVVPVPGMTVDNFLEDPRLAILTPEDGYVSSENWRARNICLHTTKGIPGGSNHTAQTLVDGFGPGTSVGLRSAAYCRNNPDAGRSRHGGHHLTFDNDGHLSCHMDLIRVAAYHGHACNRYSIGIEMYQDKDGSLHEGMLDTVVTFLDWLTRSVVTQEGRPAPVQRQIHRPYAGRPISRLDVGGWGRDVCGLYGHRDASATRGQGDPGDFIFDKLAAAGYEAYDFGRRQDIIVWEGRQAALLGLRPHAEREHGPEIAYSNVDGVPGPGTARLVEQAGKPHGLWVSRPGD